MSYHNSVSILPIPREGGLSLQTLAKNYWGTTGSMYELWDKGNDKYVIIVTSGNYPNSPGDTKTFHHDQTFVTLFRAKHITTIRFDKIDTVVKKLKIRSMYAYK